MKLITKDTGYAIQAILFIDEQKEDIVSVSMIAKSLKIPHSFLRKILQKLSKKKILRSYKGKNGGFALNKPLDKIFLFKLIIIFQGEIELSNCVIQGKTCPWIELCKLRKKLKRIQKAVVSELENVSLASLQYFNDSCFNY